VIRVEALSRSYDDGARGKVRVLDGVALFVHAGEFVAITGRSGSGKSTLLHVLGGLDTAFTGSVEVAGTKLAGLGDAALSRFRNETIGFVFQSFHLVPGLSSVDNVSLPSSFSVSEPSDVAQRAKSALERRDFHVPGRPCILENLVIKDF
jgi:putative ABC transport system ATP-binding protein